MTTLTNAQKLKNIIAELNDIVITEKDDLKKVINKVIDSFFENKSTSDKTKKSKNPSKKRSPSAYNLFVQEKIQIADIKKLPFTERMKAISVLWNEQKNSQ
jgi:hypothetical protein